MVKAVARAHAWSLDKTGAISMGTLNHRENFCNKNTLKLGGSQRRYYGCMGCYQEGKRRALQG